jgi:AraC-like DNA-binding protein
MSIQRSPDMQPARASRHIYVWDRLVLQLEFGIRNARHRHFGAFLLLAPDAPIEIRVDNYPRIVSRAALVAPYAWHQLDARNSRVATLLLGPDHPWFGYVTPILDGAPVIPFPLSSIAPGVDWKQLFDGETECAAVVAFVERTLASLSSSAFKPHAIDPRTAAAVQLLNQPGGAMLTPAALANQVGLSSVALMRRFKRELGVRIREYALWRRLLNVLPLIDSSRTLTEIAQIAGFYDQAHLTRTSRRMFDLRPSIVSGPGRARIHVCDHTQGAVERLLLPYPARVVRKSRRRPPSHLVH